jgi:hypothetical protein
VRVVPTRREAILFGAIGAIAVVAAANAADTSARAFLVAIYNAYKGKDGKGVALTTDAVIRRYFEPGVAALMIKDMKESEKKGEAPALDGDPFVDSQDWEIESFEIAVKDTGPAKASGTVTFESFGKSVTVVLDLVKLKEGWRVADITWQRDGQTETLRGLYVQQ